MEHNPQLKYYKMFNDMVFPEPTGVTHTRVLQEQMENQHASFQQRPLLVAHFDSQLPNKEYLTDPDDEMYKNDVAWEEFQKYQATRRFAINMIAMVCLYRRLPLEALVNLFRHEEAQHVATIAETLCRGSWIHWDEDREEFFTPKLPSALEAAVFNKRYPMPMVCEPAYLWNEKDSPYLTEQRSQSVLGEYNGQRTNLDTLNALNSIPLRINHSVAKQAPDPFKDDDKFRRDSVAVFGRIANETFYLTWQFDFRGRVYARGYHVNPQGDDWHKHIIQFGG